MFLIGAHGLPEPEREVMLCAPERKWRFDLVWRPLWLTVEVQGGIWTRGAHGRPSNIERDCEKIIEAQLRGWTVLPIPTGWIGKGGGRAIRVIRDAMRRIMEEEWYVESADEGGAQPSTP